MRSEVTESTVRPALSLVSGRAVAFVATFFIPIVLVRMFDQAEFGTYKQLFLIYSTLYGIAQLGMAESLFYFLPLAPRQAGRYTLNSVLVLAAGGLACFVLLAADGGRVSRWLSNSELAVHVTFIGAYLLLMLVSAVLEIVMISSKHYVRAALCYGLSEVVRAALFIAPALLLRRLDWVLVGAVAFASLRAGVALVYLRREFGRELRLDPRLLKEQLAYAVPFGAAGLVAILESNFHQYIVSYHFDAATFAIYAVGCLQMPFVEFVATSVASVMMVEMSEGVKTGRTEQVLAIWHETTRKLALFFFPLVGLLLVTARELIVFLFTESYAPSVPVFMVWSTAILFAAFQTDGVMRVYAQTRLLFGLYLLKLALIAALINWFLRAFYLPGAVLVTVLALVVAKGLMLGRMRSLMQISVSRLLPWRSLAGILAVTALAALAALIVKTPLDISALPSLVVTAGVYGGVYLGVLYRLGLVTERERLAVRGWFERRTGDLAKPQLRKT